MSSGFWTWHALLPRSKIVFTPFSLDSCSSHGSPLRGCFPPSPHMQGPVSSYSLCRHHVLEHSSDFTCLCVCMTASRDGYAHGEREAGPCFASHVSTPAGICQMNELSGLTSKAAAFSPTTLFNFQFREVKALRGHEVEAPMKLHGTFLRLCKVTLIALKCEL